MTRWGCVLGGQPQDPAGPCPSCQQLRGLTLNQSDCSYSKLRGSGSFHQVFGLKSYTDRSRERWSVRERSGNAEKARDPVAPERPTEPLSVPIASGTGPARHGCISCPWQGFLGPSNTLPCGGCGWGGVFQLSSRRVCCSTNNTQQQTLKKYTGKERWLSFQLRLRR